MKLLIKIYMFFLISFSSVLFAQCIDGDCENTGFFGEGTYIFSEGEKIVTSVYMQGDKYVGDFKDSKMHGKGTLTYIDGHEYVGDFKGGEMNGEGVFTWSDGAVYVGEYKDDRRNGEGTYIWSGKWAGDKYVGAWKENNMHGQGTYTYGPKSKSAGDQHVGAWKDNNMHGLGTYTYASGDKYVGHFKNGVRHGMGVYTNADGSIYHSGEWKNGEKWVDLVFEKDKKLKEAIRCYRHSTDNYARTVMKPNVDYLLTMWDNMKKYPTSVGGPSQKNYQTMIDVSNRIIDMGGC